MIDLFTGYNPSRHHSFIRSCRRVTNVKYVMSLGWGESGNIVMQTRDEKSRRVLAGNELCAGTS